MAAYADTAVTQAVFYEPHCDDGILSMGLAMAYYLAAGVNVHLVSMTRGGNGGPFGHFNGTQPCGWHSGVTHHPDREGYTVPPTTADAEAWLGDLRVAESGACLRALSTITPNPGVAAAGQVFHHLGVLPDGFAGTGPTPTAAGIAAAQDVIASYVNGANAITNAFHFTMSPTDAHQDHAACGQALRNVKAANPTALGAPRFFVSRKYWGPTPPRPQAVQDEGPEWFGTTITDFGALKPKLDAVVRMAASCFGAWHPPKAMGVGYHQVVGQFNTCFGPGQSIGNLWHD